MNKKYIPQKGEIVWLEFEPQLGKEIKKRRPALILSPKEYNQFGLCLAVPITSKIKNYPFEVKIKTKDISGAILSDSIKNFDWRHRKAKLITKADNHIVKEVLTRLSQLLQPN